VSLKEKENNWRSRRLNSVLKTVSSKYPMNLVRKKIGWVSCLIQSNQNDWLIGSVFYFPTTCLGII
jgi:hypothetical protein